MFERRLSLILVLVVIATLWATAGAEAALRVEPLRAQIKARPGQRFQFTIRLTNLSATEPTEVALEPSDVAQGDDGRLAFPAAGETPYSCAEWLSLPAPTVALAGREVYDLVITGRVPARTQGTRHGAIMIIPGGAPAPRGGGMVVAMVMRIAFLVDFILPGAARTDVTIDSLEMVPATEVMPATTPADMLAQYQDRTAMRITCNNLGESGTVVSGYAYLRAAATGRIVQKMQLGDRGFMLLPLSKVRTNVIFPQKLSSGGYAVEVRAHYGERKRRLEASQLFQVAETGEATAVGEFGSQAERYSLRLSPERMKLPLKAALTTTRQLYVKNEEQVPLDCTAQVVGFGVELDGTVIEEALGTNSEITVSPEQFTIPASAAIRLRVQATLGEGLEPTQEHYWMVKVTGRPQEAKEGEVGAALAASLLVGADPRQVQPAAPELAGTEVQQGLDNTVFQLVVHNAGGSALLLKGKLTVNESGGEEIASLPVPQSEEITVLAGSSRLLKVTVLQAMADKPWECELALQLGPGQEVKFPFQVKPVPKSLPPPEQEESGST
ncbi:MAG: hypothetical protein KAW89_08010 [Armatimonadetes bacterium]|nr:hypothetical protein [Armatimonadota bacterium]